VRETCRKKEETINLKIEIEKTFRVCVRVVVQLVKKRANKEAAAAAARR
jgi:hypothetical protein